MILKNLSYLILISFFILVGCENRNELNKRDGLTVYQEAQISWVRNFNPLSPAGSARWPTSAGIYEPLFIYNSMSGEFVRAHHGRIFSGFIKCIALFKDRDRLAVPFC